MIFTSLFIGALLVGSVLTFIALGFTSPVPWLFLLTIAGVIVFSRRCEKRHFVTWKDEYSVGIEAIDTDHQKLLSLINQFQTAVLYKTGKQFILESFEELLSYTKTHFEREEQLMSQHGYPDFEAHLAEHKKMIAQVEKQYELYQQQGNAALKDSVAFLKVWLIDHINGTDQRYAKHLHDKGVR